MRCVAVFGAAVIVGVVITGCSPGGSGSASPSSTSAGATTSTSLAATTGSTSRAEYFAANAGSAERRCVDVDKAREDGEWKDVVAPDGSTSRQLTLRSGEIVAGNLYELVGAGERGSADFVVKIWWVPLDPDIPQTTDLTVTASSIDDPEADPIVAQFGYASNAGGFFWPSGISLPGDGRWRLTAEAGDLWGCFELSV